jgi:hypothetical protein
LLTSWRTSRMNFAGFVLAILAVIPCFEPPDRLRRALFFNLQTLAGVEGLEPATPGFGDRCSTN